MIPLLIRHLRYGEGKASPCHLPVAPAPRPRAPALGQFPRCHHPSSRHTHAVPGQHPEPDPSA